ncbi:MAG: glycosyl hydrolase 53 family protein [Muribaculaceae bacterium]|nr:glycosyl hydrolase 53 family protein [Muribaculaceae bacterium]
MMLALMVGVLGLMQGHAEAFPRYVGGDISLLPDYEAAGSKYNDHDGKPIPDFLQFCYDEGMNAMRVRLFVDPQAYPGQDPNAKQDLAYIIPLCQKIRKAGLALMLDFHYSDTWADPVKQWTPKAWEGLSDTELYQKIYEYTKETLQTLKENGVVPQFIQTGNEISYGMLWGPANTKNPLKVYTNDNTNWPRFLTLLRKAIQACREECPEAKIVLHNERVAKPEMLKFFYEKVSILDYDIIGLSYYPYFHGNMSVLEKALDTVTETAPDKNVMIVETGYSYRWEVPGTDQKVDYPYSEAGQDQFAQDLVNLLLKYDAVDGLFWWWMEYNPYGAGLSGWYNASLFNPDNGRAFKAFETICGFGTGHEGIDLGPDPENPDDPNASVGATGTDDAEGDALWFDVQGRALKAPTAPGLYIRRGKKVVICN